MIVVSDTTPIISLMKTGQLELLQKLFGVVYIPKAVYQELTENETFLEEVRIVQEREFVYVEEVGNEKSVTILRKFTGLDGQNRVGGNGENINKNPSTTMKLVSQESTLMIYDRHPKLQSKWDKVLGARRYYVETIHRKYILHFILTLKK